MKLPTYYRQRVPTGEVGAVRVRPSEMSKEFAAKAKFGEAITGIAETLNKAEADTQFSTSRRKAKEKYLELHKGYETNPDYATYEGDYKKTLRDIDHLAPKNPAGAKQYKTWLDTVKPAWQLGVNSARRRRQITTLDTDSTINLQLAKKTGDRNGAKLAIDVRVKNGLWTELEGTEAIRTLDSEMDFYAAANYLQTWQPIDEIDDPAVLMDISDIQTSEVVKLLDLGRFKNLTPEHKALLIDDAATTANDRRKSAKMKLDSIQQQTDVVFFGRYGVDLRPSEVKAAVAGFRLTREAGDRWLDRLADPRDYPTDPATEAQILRDLNDPTSGITTTNILDLVGEPDGLSTNDARRILADMDVYKSFWFKRADQYLKQNLGWSDTFVKFEHPEGALAYSLAMEELFTVIEKGELKDKDLYDRAREIATPHLVNYWENALFLQPQKIARMVRMLKIKEPEVEPEAKPEIRPPAVRKLKPKQQAARKARIRRWVVPFNLKYKTKLQPSLLDKMSDEYIDWLASLTPLEREDALRKIDAGETVEIKKVKKGTPLDPEGIFQ